MTTDFCEIICKKSKKSVTLHSKGIRLEKIKNYYRYGNNDIIPATA